MGSPKEAAIACSSITFSSMREWGTAMLLFMMYVVVGCSATTSVVGGDDDVPRSDFVRVSCEFGGE